MSDKNSATTNGGIGFCGLLTITFIILKLTNIISWSWVWVLAPVWIMAVLVILIWLIPIIIFVVKKKRKRYKK